MNELWDRLLIGAEQIGTVLPALAAPLVFAGVGAAGLAHPPLWGAITVLALAARGVNLLVTVAAGVVVVAVLRATV